MSIMSMIERVDLEKGSRQDSEIKQLNLDNCKSTEIEGITDKFDKLEHLSLVNIGLQSISALPSLCSLKKIDLVDNRLSGGLEPLTKCSKLQQISLSGNEIKTLDVLAPLKELKQLRCLDLLNCPVTETEKYRQSVFEMIPQLKYLDGFDENNAEEPSEIGNGEAKEVSTNGKKADNDGEGNDYEEYEDEEDGDDEDDEDDDEDEEDDEEELERGYALAALRDSAELEDDEEDYVPPVCEEDDEDFDEEDEDDDEALEAEAADESGVANLSSAGVSGPRRAGAVKRRKSDLPAAVNGVNSAKKEGDAKNGTGGAVDLEAEDKDDYSSDAPPSKKKAVDADGDANAAEETVA